LVQVGSNLSDQDPTARVGWDGSAAALARVGRGARRRAAVGSPNLAKNGRPRLISSAASIGRIGGTRWGGLEGGTAVGAGRAPVRSCSGILSRNPRCLAREEEREEMAERFLTMWQSSADAQLVKRGGGTVAWR
jgi:hypothetical protein